MKTFINGHSVYLVTSAFHSEQPMHSIIVLDFRCSSWRGCLFI